MNLLVWEAYIVNAGLFVLFVVKFVKFVVKEIRSQ